MVKYVMVEYYSVFREYLRISEMVMKLKILIEKGHAYLHVHHESQVLFFKKVYIHERVFMQQKYSKAVQQ